MDESDFDNPSGAFHTDSASVKAFIPNDLPPDIDYGEIIGLTTEAHTQLGILSGLGESIPNPDLLIAPYVRTEAVLSSKIEGTQASIVDIFRFDAQGKPKSYEATEKRIQEVVNYVDALDDCLAWVNSGEDIGLSMMEKAHHILLHDVRGQDRIPGKFRTVQNWIGPEGSAIDDARYVPPPAGMLNDLLAKMEGFIQNPPAGIPVLIQCALIHYQFEAIHPFADGNGRIGRLLIPLILADRGMLRRPFLYLSAYFERNRAAYYEHLLNVSAHGGWMEWIRFFLNGVIQQSQEAINSIKKLMELKSAYDKKLREKKASRSAIMLTERLFANPMTTISAASRYLDITYPPAKAAIMHLQEYGILKESGRQERNKTYVAREILEIFTSKPPALHRA